MYKFVLYIYNHAHVHFINLIVLRFYRHFLTRTVFMTKTDRPRNRLKSKFCFVFKSCPICVPLFLYTVQGQVPKLGMCTTVNLFFYDILEMPSSTLMNVRHFNKTSELSAHYFIPKYRYVLCSSRRIS
jgi:hypothetical protein